MWPMGLLSFHYYAIKAMKSKDHVLSQGEIKTKQWKYIYQVLKSSEPLGQFQTNSAKSQICLLFRTGFSSEQCGLWTSCYLMVLYIECSAHQMFVVKCYRVIKSNSV